MEELKKTQEYAAERERRRMQQPYEGDDRRSARASSNPPTTRMRPSFRSAARTAPGGVEPL